MGCCFCRVIEDNIKQFDWASKEKVNTGAKDRAEAGATDGEQSAPGIASDHGASNGEAPGPGIEVKVGSDAGSEAGQSIKSTTRSRADSKVRSVDASLAGQNARLDEKYFTRASLSGVRGWDAVYRLDFKMKYTERLEKPVGTFVLKQSENLTTPIRTPVSANTESPEVFQLAKRWLKTCETSHKRCSTRSNPPFNPTRLIDLKKMNSSGKVYLVKTDEPKEDQPTPDEAWRYTTLSHRWGGSVPLQLKVENFSELQAGIEVTDQNIPKTFRDAMEYTNRLGIRYIWIDSLCIIQGHRDDWLAESARMDKVYGNSFCNISATAAENSDEGLFFERRPDDLWEHDIYLSTKSYLAEGDSYATQRCTVIDPTFWERNVDQASVNTRGWVLQERLIAPRVLHFCRNQIAWECNELQAAECHPEGLPNLQLVAGDVVQRRKLKGLDPGKDGKGLREARISYRPNITNRYLLASSVRLTIIYEGSKPRLSIVDPDRHLRPEIYAHELWKHIVEAYSKMNLTKDEDKLIALAGIAQVMSREIDDEYIAGMWREYLPSHLLWHVNERYEDGHFSYTSTRSSVYRAPSFSWASLNTPSGITYAETTDQDLFIDIKDVKLGFENVKLDPEMSERFGLVKTGHLVLKAVTMKRVQIEKIEANGTLRYGWRLKSGDRNSRPYSNVYLDSPESDADIFEEESHVFCVPAARGDRSESSKYLICLLIWMEEPGEQKYKRVGLMKVAPYDRQVQWMILSESGVQDDRNAEDYLQEPKNQEIWIV